MEILYMGFTQQESIRKYLFHGIVPRSPATRPPERTPFHLTADLSSFAKHEIPFQDGPELCLQILNSALGREEDMTDRFASYAVSEKEFSEYAAAKAAAKAAKSHRRKPPRPPKPSAASQLRWPRAH